MAFTIWSSEAPDAFLYFTSPTHCCPKYTLLPRAKWIYKRFIAFINILYILHITVLFIDAPKKHGCFKQNGFIRNNTFIKFYTSYTSSFTLIAPPKNIATSKIKFYENTDGGPVVITKRTPNMPAIYLLRNS